MSGHKQIFRSSLRAHVSRVKNERMFLARNSSRPEEAQFFHEFARAQNNEHRHSNQRSIKAIYCLFSRLLLSLTLFAFEIDISNAKRCTQ